MLFINKLLLNSNKPTFCVIMKRSNKKTIAGKSHPRRKGFIHRLKKRRPEELSSFPGHLKITCPNAFCQQKIVLRCPICHKGVLHCDETNYLLVCENCHNHFRDFSCYHCGFTIRPSYVKDKQEKLRKIKANADGGKIKAILFGFSFFALFIWLMSLIK